MAQDNRRANEALRRAFGRGAAREPAALTPEQEREARVLAHAGAGTGGSPLPLLGVAEAFNRWVRQKTGRLR